MQQKRLLLLPWKRTLFYTYLVQYFSYCFLIVLTSKQTVLFDIMNVSGYEFILAELVRR